MKKKKNILILLLLFLFPMSVSAHHGTEGNITGRNLSGPIITIPAITLPNKKFVVTLGGNYLNYENFSDRELINLNNMGKHIHTVNHIFSPALSLGYGLTDDISLSLQIPYVFKYDLRTSYFNMAYRQGDSIGFGDIILSGQYRFFKNEKYDLHASVISGIKFPTGSTRVKDDQGILYEADDQPTGGSFDPIVGFAITKGYMGFSFDANGLYKFATTGAQKSNLGDVVTFNSAVSYRVKNKYLNKIFIKEIFHNKLDWDLIFEGNGQFSEKPIVRHNGIISRDENHGGLVYFLTPGLRLIYDKNWILSIGTSLPVIRSLYGNQKGPNVGLTFNVSRTFN